jgi:hypothetical protein
MKLKVVSLYVGKRSLLGTVVLMAALAGCDDHEPAHASEAPLVSNEAGLSEAKRQELLSGYELLANTLADESKLGKLEIVKKLMLDAPNDRIGKLMDGLSHVSETRADELEELRKLEPQVSDKPARSSPIGEAINDIAKDFGKDDMLSRKGGFDVRFVLVQAQATRMVAAMSAALARFEPHPKRKQWLEKVSRDYEDYRGDLIEYLGARSAD